MIDTARIDAGRQTVVGVNKYRLDEKEDIDVRSVDNSAVRMIRARWRSPVHPQVVS